MKRLILAALLFCLPYCSIANNNENRPFGDENRVQVIFNRTLDFNAIVKIKLDLSEKGIVLTYKSLEFDETGKLKSIEFEVNCKDGFSGSAGMKNLTNQSRLGFYRDYSKNVVTPFKVGTI